MQNRLSLITSVICRAELTQAGSYAVRVGMQGHMLPSWPQALHVQPCASDASQCWLSGAILQVQHQPVLSVVFIACAHRGSHAKLLPT